MDKGFDVGYFELLRSVHRFARPRTYLEIGVFRGDSLRLTTRSTRVVGVDPNPLIEGRLPRRWSVYAETSDAFFDRPDVATITGRIDVAFIDGLHHYEQVLRDFMNVERLMGPDGVVLVHDCLPHDAAVAGREPTPGCWAGDVWKVIPILVEHRPDLTVEVAAAAPSGLGIVTGLDPASTVLSDRFDEIVTSYAELPFARWSPVVPGTWTAVRDRFPRFRVPHLGDEVRRKARTARTMARRRLGRAERPRS